jgi:hypothetical protein
MRVRVLSKSVGRPIVSDLADGDGIIADDE